MNKYLLLILLTSGLIGCAKSNLYISAEPRISGTKFGNWSYEEVYDEFDGLYTISSITSDDKKASLKIIRSESSKIDAVEYSNGDTYICRTFSGWQPLRFKFFTDTGEEIQRFVFSQKVNENQVLYTNTDKDYEYETSNVHGIVSWLQNSKKVMIRSIDGCGTTIDRVFKIEGTPHLIPGEF